MMGVFNGIEILFFFLGIMFTCSVLGLVYLKMILKVGPKELLLAGLGSFLLLFCIGWSVSSLLEGEPQAANMGLVVFGIPAMALFGALYRMIKKATESVCSPA